MSDAVAAVQARIAQIRSYIQPVATTTTASTTTASGTSGTTATAFAAALAQATGTTGALADPATVPAGALSTTVTGQQLVDSATKYLGVPYVWGGESLDEGGLDCSGLVLRSLADLGITSGVPRVARDQATLGQEVPSLDQALPGDLVVLNGGKHIGIYVGDGQMIDAPKPGRSVTIRDVYAEPTTIRRVLPQAAATTASTTTGAFAATAAGQQALALLTGGSSAGTASTSALAALSGLTSGSGLAAGTSSQTLSALSSLWGAAS